MKHIEICAMKDDRKELLHALQKKSVIMIVSDDDTVSPENDAELQKALDDADASIAFAKQSGKVKGLRPEKVVSFDELDSAAGESKPLVEESLKTKDEIEQIGHEMSSISSMESSLAPWTGLDARLSDIKDTKTCRVITGLVGSSQSLELPEDLTASVHEYGTTPDGKRAVLIISHESCASEVEKFLREHDFSEVSLPDVPCTAGERIAELEKENADDESRLEELRAKAAGYASSIDSLEIGSDSAATALARSSVPVAFTDKTFMITGWCAADRVDELTETVLSVAPYALIDSRDPLDDEQPPTLTKNNHIISQFETLTDMFSRPDPRGVDPNPVMGPWYWLIFGMMMGDAGYGVLMAILFYVLKKVLHPKGETLKLMNILEYCSITTIFWGIVFGSYFGASWFEPLLFPPLDEPVKALLFSVIVGILHIFTGMLVKVWDLCRHGKWLDAIFDEISWMVLITGLGFLFIDSLKGVGKWMAIIGAAVILLTGGRDRKGVFGKAIGGVLSLYNISSYFSDIVSYTRIIALMLSSGVIGMVMNLLAGMVQTSVIGYALSFIIYIIGHAFNLVMGLLSAYVHDSRLQYIEFFGKFYDGGGYQFTPLSAQTKYVTLDNSADR
ncbi:MAG: V-type ATP synthase subunit I [Oscillospiraceae bacterium]